MDAGRRHRRARMQDVATAAEVDISVVSRVLSGDTSLIVRPETRQRVLEAIERLDYQPNAAARALRTSRTMAIGMLIPDLANVVYAAIARGAEKQADASGYVLLIGSGQSARRRAILESRIDGLLYAIATTGNVPAPAASSRVPSLLLNRREPGAGPSAIVDDEGGVAAAVAHLVSLGHRRIAHVGGLQTVDTGRRRRAGYLRAMAEHELSVAPKWIVDAPYDEAGGADAAARLLLLAPRPTAIVAASLTAAIGAMASVREAGLSIPGDISVVGLHDAPVARYLDPPLTTVRMPLAELGGRAVVGLLAMIDGETIEDIVLTDPPELIERRSCAAPR